MSQPTSPARGHRRRPRVVLVLAFAVAALLAWVGAAAADVPASQSLLSFLAQSHLRLPPGGGARVLIWLMLLAGLAGALVSLGFELIALRRRLKS